MGLLSTTAPAEQNIKGRLVNIDQTANLAQQFAQKNWGLSDADLEARFPGRLATNNAAIAGAYKDLQGPDARTQGQFVKQGFGTSLGAFGDGAAGEGIGQNTIASAVANQGEDYQNNARSYFDQLTADNPEREFLPEDFRLQLALANTDQANQLRTAQKNADYQHGVAVHQAGEATEGAYAHAILGLL